MSAQPNEKPAAQARGPYAKSALTRQAILDAARDSFTERGYDGASLRDIAQRAGLSHAGILHHFDSKEAVLAALLEQRDAEELRRSTSRSDHSRNLLADLLREHQQNPELMRLWAELAPAAARADHPAHEYFVDRYERARQMFTQWLATSAPENGIHPEHAALLFIAVLDGLQTQWLLDQSLDIIEALAAFRVLLSANPPQ